RPAHDIAAAPPLHPSRPPLRSWNPGPAPFVVIDPATIVIRHQAPSRLFLIFDPVPAPVVGVDPVSDRIGPPVARPVGRNPNLAPTRVALPSSIRFQRGSELDRDRNLGLRRRSPSAGRSAKREKTVRLGRPPKGESGFARLST